MGCFSSSSRRNRVMNLCRGVRLWYKDIIEKTWYLWMSFLFNEKWDELSFISYQIEL